MLFLDALNSILSISRCMRSTTTRISYRILLEFWSGCHASTLCPKSYTYIPGNVQENFWSPSCIVCIYRWLTSWGSSFNCRVYARQAFLGRWLISVPEQTNIVFVLLKTLLRASGRMLRWLFWACYSRDKSGQEREVKHQQIVSMFITTREEPTTNSWL